jgi:hypothetical protein
MKYNSYVCVGIKRRYILPALPLNPASTPPIQVLFLPYLSAFSRLVTTYV